MVVLVMVQSTFGGFGLINQENVFKVCDQPHPLLVGSIIANCLKLKIDDAYDGMRVRHFVPSNTIYDSLTLGHAQLLLEDLSRRIMCQQESMISMLQAFLPVVQALCDLGYSAMDIITTVFRVVRNYDMHEFLKLEFIKVGCGALCLTAAGKARVIVMKDDNARRSLSFCP